MSDRKSHKKLRKTFFQLINPSNESNDIFFSVDLFIISLIILNVLALILQSVPSFDQKYGQAFYYFEFFSVVVFTIEYLIRLWTSVELKKYSGFGGRLRWMFSFFALVDLFAILPFYLPLIGLDLRFIRLLRLFRMVRLLKLTRYTSAINLIRSTLINKKTELIITFVISSILLVFFSTIMYYAEREVQPESFGSIPDAMWWGVVTMTTIGYGDAYPITALGKIIAAFIAIVSIGMFALPTGILASGFSDELEKRKLKQ